MRWPRTIVWLTFAVMTFGVFGITSCTQRPASQCAGQCGARSMLVVVFKAGVQHDAAESALAACLSNPDVVRISSFSTTSHPLGGVPPGRHGSHLTATIYLRTMGQTANSLALASCLRKQPTILDAAGIAYAPIHGTG